MAATHVGEFPAQAPNNKNTLIKRGLAGLGIAAAAFAGTSIAENFNSHHSDSATAKNPTSTSAGLGYEAEQKTPKLTLAPETVETLKRFDSNIGTANAAVRHGLDIHGLGYGNFFPVDAGPASKNMTPEQIVARDMAKVMWLKTNPDRNQASLDAAIISPSGAGPYKSMVTILDSTNPADHDSIDVEIVKGKPYHFTSGTHDGVISQGDTWLIDTEPITTGVDYVHVFEWYQNPNGSGGEYLNTKTYSKQDTPDFTTTYNDLLPHPTQHS